MKIKINYIVPLGSQCFSAYYLKNNNLKISSYPFDWIFSNPLIILDMLNDNFEKFLNKDNYVIKDINSKINRHTIYLPELILFNHRNPYNDKDYLYYLKCIDRFYKVLLKNDNKLFLFTFLDNEIKNEIENIFLLKNKISELTNNFYIIAIFQQKKGFQTKEIYKYDNIIIIQIYTIDSSDGVIFFNDYDTEFYKNIINEFYEFDLYY